MQHGEHILCLWLMLVSVHRHCLCPSESLLSTAKDKLIMGKHCSGSLFGTVWIPNWLCKKVMKMNGRDLANVLFTPLTNCRHFHLFSPCCVTLGNTLHTCNKQFFFICKMEGIIVFIAHVILRIKRNITGEMLNMKLSNKCSDHSNSVQWASSSANSHF